MNTPKKPWVMLIKDPDGDVHVMGYRTEKSARDAAEALLGNKVWTSRATP